MPLSFPSFHGKSLQHSPQLTIVYATNLLKQQRDKECDFYFAGVNCELRLHDAPFQLKPFQRQNEMFGGSNAKTHANCPSNLPMSNAALLASDFQASSASGVSMQSTPCNVQSAHVFPPLPPLPSDGHGPPTMHSSPSSWAAHGPNEMTITAISQSHRSHDMPFSHPSRGGSAGQMQHFAPINSGLGSPQPPAMQANHGSWGCNGVGCGVFGNCGCGGCAGAFSPPFGGQQGQQMQPAQDQLSFMQQSQMQLMQSLPTQEFQSMRGHTHLQPVQPMHATGHPQLQSPTQSFTGPQLSAQPAFQHPFEHPTPTEQHSQRLVGSRGRSRSPRHGVESRSAPQSGGELV